MQRRRRLRHCCDSGERYTPLASSLNSWSDYRFMVVWLDVYGCLKELLRIYGVFLVNLWEVIGHLWQMGFSQVNSALLACLCDFLQSIERIVVILVSNGRLFRYLHLGMWFVIFGCLWWDRWPFPFRAILSRSVWGSNDRLVRHTELFWYAVFAQFCVFEPSFGRLNLSGVPDQCSNSAVSGIY